MDKIRELLGKPIVTAALGFLLGLIIGLPVLGWGLFPVEYYDASARDLRADLQQEWLRMTIIDYGRTGDAQRALARWQELEEKGPEILPQLMVDQSIDAQTLANFSQLVQQPGVAILPTQPEAGGEVLPGDATPQSGDANPVLPLPTQAAPTAETDRPFNPITLLVVLCLVTLLVGGALFYFLVLRKRQGGAGSLFGAVRAPKAEPVVMAGDYDVDGQAPPVAQFMTTYNIGEDLYDDSFSIDSPTGEFLGECGVGITETIGAGEPKRVTAFEVWLFDKNDIQTVTKVLMSEHAYNDPATVQRLSMKGEPIMIAPGERVILETQTLILEAAVTDLMYGQGTPPEGSYFDRLTLRLSVWPKV